MVRRILSIIALAGICALLLLALTRVDKESAHPSGSKKGTRATLTSTVNVTQNTPYTINANPNNDKDPQSFVLLVAPTVGTLNNTQLLLRYTPNNNYIGSDSFTYSLCNFASACDINVVNIFVNPYPVPLCGVNPSLSTNKNVSLTFNISSYVTDVGGVGIDYTTLTFPLSPVGGTTTYNNNANITYTPTPQTVGLGSVNYRVCDRRSQCCNNTIAVGVRGMVCTNTSVQTDLSYPITFSLLSYVQSYPLPFNLTSTSIVSKPTKGNATAYPNGNILYSPNAGSVSNDTFTYRICDNSTTCCQAQIVMTIRSTAPPPTCISSSSTAPVDVPENGNYAFDIPDDWAIPSTFQGQVNIIDPSTVRVISGPFAQFPPTAPVKAIVVQGTGSKLGWLTYIPPPYYIGTDSFAYRVRDVLGRTCSGVIRINVYHVPSPPLCSNTTGATLAGVPISFDSHFFVSSVQSIVDDSSIKIISPPKGATASVNTPYPGVIRYSPFNSFRGTDSFQYAISDTGGLSCSGLIRVTVSGDLGPNCYPKRITVQQGRSITFTLNVTVDIGSVLNYTLSVPTYPANGDVSLGDLLDITYTPNAGFFGIETFTYLVFGDSGKSCSGGPANITINVTRNAQGPTCPVGDVSVFQNTARNISMTNLVNAADKPLNTTSLRVTASASHGTVSVRTGGYILYTPAINYVGRDSFNYSICDSGGLCCSSIVNLNVNTSFSVPVCSAATITVFQQTASVLNITRDYVFDPDGQDQLDTNFLAVLDPPRHGRATARKDGTITYVSDASYLGNDSFSYTISTKAGLSCTNIISLIVIYRVLPPNCQPSTQYLNQRTNITIPMVSSGLITDPQGALNVSSLVLTRVPPSAQVISTNLSNGDVFYAPVSTFYGTDTFSYFIQNTYKANCSSTITLVVVQVTLPPICSDARFLAFYDTALVIDIPSLVTDPNNLNLIDPSSVHILNAPLTGAAYLDQATGLVTYVPIFGFTGEDRFQYDIANTAGRFCSGLVVLNVTAPTLPTCDTAILTTQEDTLVQDYLFGYSSAATFFLLSTPSNGTAQLSQGRFSYTPDPFFRGNETLTYQGCNGGLCCTASVVVVVEPTNPVCSSATLSVLVNTELDVNVTSLVTHTGRPVGLLSITITQQPFNGVLLSTDASTGLVVYQPFVDFVGADFFSYTVEDATELSCSADGTVAISVYPPSPSPSASSSPSSSRSPSSSPSPSISNSASASPSPSPNTPSLSSSPTTPSPSPSATTPSPSPSATTPSPSPSAATPSLSPSATTPSPSSAASVSPSVSPSSPSTPSPSPSATTPSPSPSATTPSPSSSATTPSPSSSPVTPSPSPSATTPSPSSSLVTPSPSPSAVSPSLTASPSGSASISGTESPSPSPNTPSTSPSISTTPSVSPSPNTPSPSPSGTQTPSPSPSPNTPSVSPSPNTPSPSPSATTPSPSPSPSASDSVSPSPNTPSPSPSPNTPSPSPSATTPSPSTSPSMSLSGSPSPDTPSVSPSPNTPSPSPSATTPSPSTSESMSPSVSPSPNTPSPSPSATTPSPSSSGSMSPSVSTSPNTPSPSPSATTPSPSTSGSMSLSGSPSPNTPSPSPSATTPSLSPSPNTPSPSPSATTPSPSSSPSGSSSPSTSPTTPSPSSSPNTPSPSPSANTPSPSASRSASPSLAASPSVSPSATTPSPSPSATTPSPSPSSSPPPTAPVCQSTADLPIYLTPIESDNTLLLDIQNIDGRSTSLVSDPLNDFPIPLIPSFTQPQHGGTVQLAGQQGNILLYTAGSRPGPDPFNYTVCNQHGLCCSNVINVRPVTQPKCGYLKQVMQVGDPPLQIPLMSLVLDADQSAVPPYFVTLIHDDNTHWPLHGNASQEGVVVTYSPDAGYVGDDTIVWGAMDIFGHVCVNSIDISIRYTLGPINCLSALYTMCNTDLSITIPMLLYRYDPYHVVPDAFVVVVDHTTRMGGTVEQNEVTRDAVYTINPAALSKGEFMDQFNWGMLSNFGDMCVNTVFIRVKQCTTKRDTTQQQLQPQQPQQHNLLDRGEEVAVKVRVLSELGMESQTRIERKELARPINRRNWVYE